MADDLVDRLRGEFRAEGETLLRLMDEWSASVEERTFTLNVVDVRVNFAEGWAEIADLLEPDAVQRLTLADLRAALADGAA